MKCSKEIPKHRLTDDEIDELMPGDEVYWNDPDNDMCSRHTKIEEIVFVGKTPDSRIYRIDGDTEVYGFELS